MAGYRAFVLLLTVVVTSLACGPVAAQTQVLGPISEETPPAACWAGWFVSGIRCTGRYCDNIEITCTKIPGATVGADHRWTPWVSEERPSTAWCGPGPNLIAGFACNGRYCDNISLYCVPLVNLVPIHCWSTKPVSEENGGTLSFQDGTQSGIFVATQMSCSGSYCDNKTFQVCQIKSP
jgi:hypothetical protein